LALFGKILRKITKHLQDIQKSSLGSDLPLTQPEVVRNVGISSNGIDRDNNDGEEKQVGTSGWKPMNTTVAEDLELVAGEEVQRAKALQRELIDSMDLSE